MSDDTKILSKNSFKEGKYQKEYHSENQTKELNKNQTKNQTEKQKETGSEQRKEYQDYLEEIDIELDFETESAYKWLGQQNKELNKDQDENQNPSEQNPAKLAAKAAHYKDVAFGYQFIQLATELTRDMNPSQAAIISHVYKYLFRLGRKDDPVQEAEKAIMYLKIFIQYYKGNGGGHFEMPEELQ